jgi:hypothetical protein
MQDILYSLRLGHARLRINTLTGIMEKTSGCCYVEIEKRGKSSRRSGNIQIHKGRGRSSSHSSAIFNIVL